MSNSEAVGIGFAFIVIVLAFAIVAALITVRLEYARDDIDALQEQVDCARDGQWLGDFCVTEEP